MLMLKDLSTYQAPRDALRPRGLVTPPISNGVCSLAEAAYREDSYYSLVRRHISTN